MRKLVKRCMCPVRFKLLTLIFALASATSKAESIPFTILHTNDLHSHFEGTGPDIALATDPSSAPVLGGYSRLACTISAIRANKLRSKEPVLLFDAGDFFAGTMFHAIAPNSTEASSPEIEFFKRMGYNAITLGNHEFDAGRLGLERLFVKARKNGASVPVVLSNLKSSSFTKSADERLFSFLNYHTFTIPTPSRTLKIGVLGLFSPNAALLSASTREGFRFFGFNEENSREVNSEFFDAAKASLNALMAAENPDIIVALTHGGEIDQKIAEKIPGINVIISGHTHKRYAIRHKDTIIAQSGSYGEYLGKLSLVFDSSSRKVDFSTPNASQEHLIAMDKNACWDASYGNEVAKLKAAASRVLASGSFKYDTPIVRIEKDMEFESISKLPLATLVWSHVRRALNTKLKEPVDVYLGNLGLLRNGFKTLQGEPVVYQFSDVFKILSVGFETIPNSSDPQKTQFVAGSPIVVFYLQKNELKNLLEFMEFYGKFSPVAIPAPSNNVEYNERWWGIPLINRLGDFKVNGKDIENLPPLMSVATTLYAANFFKNIKGLTYGLVNVTPRNKKGEPLAEFTPAGVPRDFELLAESLQISGKVVGGTGLEPVTSTMSR